MSPELQILARGPGWLAVDKPSGISTHNEPGRDAISLVAAMIGEQPSPVHRLDLETSGVLVLATERETASRLQQALEARRARKIYRAIIHGAVSPEAGEWSWPISDRSEGRDNPAGKAAERKPAVTRYRTVLSNKYFSEIEIELLTGRQHQIRRHARLAGHAVVGDKRYGEPRHVARIEKLYGTKRLMLHAQEMDIEVSAGEKFKAVAPRPTEFDRLFAET